MLQQPAFDIERFIFAAGKTAQTVFGHDAVARYYQGQRIFAAGSADGARMAADLAGDVLVSGNTAVRNGGNRLPNFLLIGGAVARNFLLEILQAAGEIIIQFLLPVFGQRVGRIFGFAAQVQRQQILVFIENQSETAERRLLEAGIFHHGMGFNRLMLNLNVRPEPFSLAAIRRVSGCTSRYRARCRHGAAVGRGSRRLFWRRAAQLLAGSGC